MRLGAKTVLTIGSTFLVLILVLLFISQTILLGSFKKLEDRDAGNNVARVSSALGEEVKNLSALNLDWASWDDTYRFVADRNPTYIHSNLNKETLIQQKLNMIIHLDRNGKIVFAKVVDHHAKREIPFPEDLRPHLASGTPLTVHQGPDSRRDGILVLDEGILMISARPIRTSKGEGPTRGTLLMGRFFDEGVSKRLTDTTHLPVTLLPYDKDRVSRLRKTADAAFSINDESILIHAVSEKTVTGYGIINDIYGQPAFLVKIDLLRGIFSQGKTSLLYFIGYLLAAAGVSALAILLLLKKNVVSRLSNLSRRVDDIASSGDLADRVSVAGNDELSALAGEINRMLGALETLELERKTAAENLRKAHDTLEMRVRDRTAELVETNVELKEEVAERRRVEDAMKEMIYHDYLTGLPNRLLFTDRLKQVIAHGGRHKNTLAAVLYMDLDRFKVVNDSLGHAAGDQLIKTVASLTQRSLRQGDTVARVGGDEFTILLSEVARVEDVPGIVDKILKIFKSPIPLMGQTVFITPSIGISIYPYDGEDPATLLKNADVAMSYAKSKGGNTFEIYHSDMTEKVLQRLTLGNKLRAALEREEFLLFYQPQYDLRKGRITGSEALIRWRDPELGLVSPSSFIPLAEETGMIVPLGEWVLRKACTLHKKLLDEGLGDLSVSVNVSARTFMEPDFTEKVKAVLSDVGMTPEHLHLEITESLLMSNIIDAGKIIKNLKEPGVKFSIDDFGTGYSSLAYLKNLAIHQLKIDGSFIKDLATDEGDRLITTAIINLAHSLNLEVMAEGVETREQLDFLIEHRCDMIQGFFFSKPLPEEAFVALIEGQQWRPHPPVDGLKPEKPAGWEAPPGP